jgi:hypothetical protein
MQHLGGQQRPRQVVAQHRHQQADADEQRTPAPGDGFHHPGHRRRGQCSQVGPQQHPIGQDGHHHQQAEHPKEAGNRGNTHVLAPACIPRIHAGTLNAYEHEHGQQQRATGLLPQGAQARRLASPQVQREYVGAETDEQEHDEHRQRHQLGHRGDRVDQRGLFDPAQDEEMESPQQHRRRQDRHHRGAIAERRKVLPERGLDQDQAGHVGQAAAQPVAHRREQAGIIAEAGPGIRVDAGVELRLQSRQRLEHERQHQHAGTGNGPGQQCPFTPVLAANAAGNAKMPEPIIEPTTSAVSSSSESVRFPAAGLIAVQPLVQRGCPRSRSDQIWM